MIDFRIGALYGRIPQGGSTRFRLLFVDFSTKLSSHRAQDVAKEIEEDKVMADVIA